MFQAFVFTTQAFVILNGTKNLGTKQPFSFRFKGTKLIVSGLRTSPKDHDLIKSGEANAIETTLKSCALSRLRIFSKSFKAILQIVTVNLAQD
jgi:hypothetical protein